MIWFKEVQLADLNNVGNNTMSKHLGIEVLK
jgi:hypothetical protein